MKNIYFEIDERYCFEFDAIGSEGYHVHLSVGAKTKYSPSKIMQIKKVLQQDKSSNNVFKKQLQGGELWNDGGYIGTIGDGTTSYVIKNYIEN